MRLKTGTCSVVAAATLRLVSAGPIVGSADSWPYQSITIPGKIAAASFDNGGQNVAYNDLTGGNAPKIRAGENVNGGAGLINYIYPGEWLKYTVNVATSGTFSVMYSIAASPPSPSPIDIYLNIDGYGCSGTKSGEFAKNYFSRGDYNPSTFYGADVTLSAGKHSITVCFAQSSYLTYGGLTLSSKSSTSTLNIRAVEYDYTKGVSGQGKNYWDDSNGNLGSTTYRPDQGVDCDENRVGWMSGGEWIKYTRTFTAGNYDLYMEAAGPGGGQFTISFQTTDTGASFSGVSPVTFTFPNTGGWTTFAVKKMASSMKLPSGKAVMKLSVNNWGADVKTISFVPSGTTSTGPGPAPAPAPAPVPKPATPAPTNAPQTSSQWKLKWSDEFNFLDTSKWYVVDGVVGVNNEQQCYKPSAVYVQNGALVLEARKEYNNGVPYTAGKVQSKAENGFVMKFGRAEANINIGASGQGAWPAFWMFPAPKNQWDWNGVYGDWPRSGEIDILESVNDLSVVHQTIHYGDVGGGHAFQVCDYYSPTGTFSNQFHVFAVEWAPWGQLKFYTDGKLTCSLTNWWSAGGSFPAPFDQNFQFIFNYAVGGDMPGGWVDGNSFNTPKQMKIDYLRVYDWPAGRRLQDVPEGWEVPEKWNLETNEWNNDSDLSAPKDADVNAEVEDGSHMRHLFGGLGAADRPQITGGDATVPDSRVWAASDCVSRPFPQVITPEGASVPQPWVLPTVPGKILIIEAEYFDEGGQGCSYRERDPLRQTGNCMLRSPHAVDIQSYDKSAHGPFVKNFEDGEWLGYTIESVATLPYNLEVIAFAQKEASFQIVIDSPDCEVSGDQLLMTGVVSGGDWLDWRSFSDHVTIPEGDHKLKLCVMDGVLNVDFMRFTRIGPAGAGNVGADMAPDGVPEPMPLIFHHGH